MNIAIAGLVVLILIAQPVMLLGLAIIFTLMAVFSRPFRWQDLATAGAVMALAVGLIHWNGGWEKSIGPSDEDAMWEYRGGPEKPEFDGCTDDCSGHEAGYRWAEENDILDRDDCAGSSNSFNEGCEQYAEEQQSVDIDPYQDSPEMSGRFGY